MFCCFLNRANHYPDGWPVPVRCVRLYVSTKSQIWDAIHKCYTCLVWVRIPVGKDIFSSSKSSRPDLMPIHQWVSGLFPWGTAAWAWSWHPSSAKLNNKWSYISCPPYAFVACTGTTLFHCHKQESIKSFNSSSSRYPWPFMINFLRQNLEAS